MICWKNKQKLNIWGKNGNGGKSNMAEMNFWNLLEL